MNIRNTYQSAKQKMKILWDSSSLEKKLALTVSLIVVGIVGLFSLVSFYITKSRYEAMLYQSMSTSSSLVTYLLSSHLEDAVQLSDALRTDPAIQRHLDIIYQQQDYKITKSYDNIYTTQQSYYQQYKKPYLIYSAIINSQFTTYTYGYKYKQLSEEIKEEMQEEAGKSLGSPVWFSKYTDEEYLFLIRQIRKIDNLELSDLGTLVIAIDMDALLAEITRESQNYQNIFWLFSQNGETIYASSELQDVSPQQIMTPIGGYGVITLNGQPYFVMEGELEDPAWSYYQLVPYDATAAAQRTLFFLYAVVVLWGLACTVFLIHFVIRRLVSDIQVLCEKMLSFHGDNVEVLNVPYDYSCRKDEIGQLHQYFDTMAKEIETLINNDYKLKLDMKNMQLKALKAQINPHFLYNTLDSIYWRAKTADNEEICIMVESLGNLLRSSLSQKDSLVPLQEELDLVNHYLTIQTIRYEERLRCSFQLDETLKDSLVPPLCIQPLVENSIKYGLELYPDVCSITISTARITEDKMCVVVKNSGSFFEEHLLERLQQSEKQTHGTGIGLLNIHQRIQLLFGSEYGLELYNKNGFAVASMQIPITKHGGTVYAEDDNS